MSQQDSSNRQPKGDQNRRVAMGLDPDQFAAEAGITTEQLRDYERTAPDHRFDAGVAERVGAALDRLEAKLPNSETGRTTVAPGFDRDEIGKKTAADPSPPDPSKGPRYTPGSDQQ